MLVTVGVVLFVALKLKQQIGPFEDFPYNRNWVLFSPGERSFLGVLEQAFGAEYRVFGKRNERSSLQLIPERKRPYR